MNLFLIQVENAGLDVKNAAKLLQAVILLNTAEKVVTIWANVVIVTDKKDNKERVCIIQQINRTTA